jgi:hypothetical protein
MHGMEIALPHSSKLPAATRKSNRSLFGPWPRVGTRQSIGCLGILVFVSANMISNGRSITESGNDIAGSPAAISSKQNSTNNRTAAFTINNRTAELSFDMKSEQHFTNNRTAELSFDMKSEQPSTNNRTAELTSDVKPEQNSTKNRTAKLSSDSLATPSDKWVKRCTKRITEKGLIPLNVTWELYRLGDCIKLCASCEGGPKNSMARQYGNLACGTGEDDKTRKHVPGGNLTFVEKVLQLHTQDPSFTIPAVDELVIHLRLGDVIEGSKAPVAEMLMHGANPAHHRNFKTAIKSVHEYISNIQESGLHKVVIRGGSHMPERYKKSRVYSECLKEAIENAGYHVSMEVEGNTPDSDFYFMSRAKTIIVSTGGYSRLMGKMVKKGGGTVVGRTF